jgi:hypothetical protein
MNALFILWGMLIAFIEPFSWTPIWNTATSTVYLIISDKSNSLLKYKTVCRSWQHQKWCVHSPKQSPHGQPPPIPTSSLTSNFLDRWSRPHSVTGMPFLTHKEDCIIVIVTTVYKARRSCSESIIRNLHPIIDVGSINLPSLLAFRTLFICISLHLVDIIDFIVNSTRHQSYTPSKFVPISILSKHTHIMQSIANLKGARRVNVNNMQWMVIAT